MKLEDIIALAKQGYKPGDIKELIELANEPQVPTQPTQEPQVNTQPPQEPQEPTQDPQINTEPTPEPAPVSEPEPVPTNDQEQELNALREQVKKLQEANTKQNAAGTEPSEEEKLLDIAAQFIN